MIQNEGELKQMVEKINAAENEIGKAIIGQREVIRQVLWAMLSGGNVLLEGAATGRALITSDIPGCREAVEEEKNGYLCKVKDAGSVEKCMDLFMLLSEDDRKKMGQSGRERMEKRFDRKKVVKKICQNIF